LSGIPPGPVKLAKRRAPTEPAFRVRRAAGLMVVSKSSRPRSRATRTARPWIERRCSRGWRQPAGSDWQCGHASRSCGNRVWHWCTALSEMAHVMLSGKLSAAKVQPPDLCALSPHHRLAFNSPPALATIAHPGQAEAVFDAAAARAVRGAAPVSLP
jgi:hypothetical protein